MYTGQKEDRADRKGQEQGQWWCVVERPSTQQTPWDRVHGAVGPLPFGPSRLLTWFHCRTQ